MLSIIGVPSLALNGVFFVFCLGLAFPARLEENGVIEAASAVGFLSASVLAAVRLIVGNLRERADRRILMVIIPSGLLLALSEIGFGRSLGLIAPPRLYGGGEFDSPHDIVILFMRLIADGVVWALVVVGLLMVAGAFASVALWQHRAAIAMGIAPYATFAGRLVLLTITLLFGAVVLDTLPYQKAILLEEAMEMVAAFVLIFAAAGERWIGFLAFRREFPAQSTRTM